MVLELIFLVETALLVVAAGVVCYPLVTHPENVAHSSAVLALAASLLLLTVGSAALAFLSIPAIANVFMLGATLAFAWSQWLFCREFVVREDEFPFTFEERSGGFEDFGSE